MICIKCGIEKKTDEVPFICNDCKKFSKLVLEVYYDLEDSLSPSESIDPITSPNLKLLADLSFVIGDNPQVSIFTKLSEFLVSKALEGSSEITEDDLNREIRTTKSWNDAFIVFEELGLIKIEIEKYRRILNLTPKLKNLSNQYQTGEALNELRKKRLAHIYIGYVILYLLKLVAELKDDNGILKLPYKQRPKTLWTTIMFLWLTAYESQDKFTDEDLISFVSKRKIPSSTRNRIIRSLQTIDGRFTNELIKDMNLDGRSIEFEFEDYIIIEMERIRERDRERSYE